MKIDDALATLRRHERELKARGIRHAAVFGSVARKADRLDSDVDILIDVEPEAPITVFDYVALKEYIAGLFDGPVDIVSRAGLKPHIRSSAIADAVDAF
jgi:predicted nucleotidyltransferase